MIRGQHVSTHTTHPHQETNLTRHGGNAMTSGRNQEQEHEYEGVQPGGGWPGDGKGRTERVSADGGVYPASGAAAPENADVQTAGAFGQGARGGEGYHDHGESEMGQFQPDSSGSTDQQSDVRRRADQVIEETHASSSGVSTNAVGGIGSAGQPSIGGTNAGESSGSISGGVGQRLAGRGSGGALGGVNRAGTDPEQMNDESSAPYAGSDEATAGQFDPGDAADAKFGYGNTPRGADATSGSTNTGGEPGEIDSVGQVVRERNQSEGN